MTRTEFIEEVCDWSSLINFCNDERLSDCEDIYDEYSRDEVVNSALRDDVRREDWETIKDWLSCIDTGYDYYRCDGNYDWVGMDDDDFESYKEDILDRYDRQDWWDEEEEEVIEEDDSEDEDEPVEEDGEEINISFSEFFEACSVEFKSVGEIAVEAEHASEEAFASFIIGG